MDVSGEMLPSLHQANANTSWLRAVSAEAPPHGATRADLSDVAGQLMEAAFRAQEGDHEGAKVHIAHAVALLQCTPNSGPTATRVVAAGERQGAASVRSAHEGYRATILSHRLDHVRLRRVLAYVSKNIDGDITLATLAGIAGYSPFHFARKFALAVGVPPHRYISRMRLKRAMAELATGELPLAEVALNAHFASQASFTRAFHRATGLTPKEYQRSRL